MVIIKNTKDNSKITPFKLYSLCMLLSKSHDDTLKIRLPKTIEEARASEKAKIVVFLLKRHKDLFVKYNWRMEDVKSYLVYMIKVSKEADIKITPQLLYSFLLGLDEKLISVFTPNKSIPDQYKDWAQREIQRILGTK